jgi:16S rRNA (uracil1498-N3)-methyltransferase
MQFIYDIKAGDDTLNIINNNHKYLFKVRRSKVDDTIFLRNFLDDFLYSYSIINIDKNSSLLKLKAKTIKIVKSNKNLHIIWSIIDPKIIEKAIPFLNQIGVDKITFVYSEYSQRNFKIDIDKLNKILINSSQQSGRSSIIELDIIKSLQDIFTMYTNILVLDFSSNKIKDYTKNINRVLIGPEAGFSSSDRLLFRSSDIIGFDSDSILQSQTAAISIAAKIVL